METLLQKKAFAFLFASLSFSVLPICDCYIEFAHFYFHFISLSLFSLHFEKVLCSANIAHTKSQSFPAGSFSGPPHAEPYDDIIEGTASCCPHWWDPLSSQVLAPSSDRPFLMLQSTQKHNGGHVARTPAPAQTGMQRILVILDKQSEDETPASRLLPVRGSSVVMQNRLSNIAIPQGWAGVYKDDTAAWPVLLTRKDIWTSPQQLGASSWVGNPFRRSKTFKKKN